ncbi:MAG: hypothetical protein V7K54_20135 [Nostoc sp.]
MTAITPSSVSVCLVPVESVNAVRYKLKTTYRHGIKSVYSRAFNLRLACSRAIAQFRETISWDRELLVYFWTVQPLLEIKIWNYK